MIGLSSFQAVGTRWKCDLRYQVVWCTESVAKQKNIGMLHYVTRSVLISENKSYESVIDQVIWCADKRIEARTSYSIRFESFAK